MRFSNLVLAVLIVSLPVTAGAQEVLIDGTANELSEEIQLAEMSSLFGQSFVAKAARLRSISLWFHAPVQYDDGGVLNLWQGKLFFGPGTGETWSDEYSRGLFPAHQGRLDVRLPQSLRLKKGETYSFFIYSDGCGYYPGESERTPLCDAIFSSDPTVYEPWRTEITVGDVYSGGTAGDGYNVYDFDLRFELKYVVPEPSSMALLLIGLIPVLVGLLRRRGCTQIQAG